MSSVGLFIGIALIILSVGATGFSSELKRLGFKKESKDLYQLAMFLVLIGFMLVMVAYPKPQPFIHPVIALL